MGGLVCLFIYGLRIIYLDVDMCSSESIDFVH